MGRPDPSPGKDWRGEKTDRYTGLIKSIPNGDGKDPNDPLTYRGITLISIPCKIYADILNTRLSNWIEENGYLAEEQNGFRQNRSFIKHIHILYSVINNRKLGKLSTYACFVDAKKAVDTINRHCLWYKLYSLGLSGKILY